MVDGLRCGRDVVGVVVGVVSEVVGTVVAFTVGVAEGVVVAVAVSVAVDAFDGVGGAVVNAVAVDVAGGVDQDGLVVRAFRVLFTPASSEAILPISIRPGTAFKGFAKLATNDLTMTGLRPAREVEWTHFLSKMMRPPRLSSPKITKVSSHILPLESRFRSAS